MNHFEITAEHKEVLYGMSFTQYKRLDTIRISNGHELFKMAIEDGIVSKVTCAIEKNRIKLTPELGHIYVGALNLKNAHKKFANILIYVNNQVVEANKIKAKADEMHILSLKGKEHTEEVKSDRPGIGAEPFTITLEEDWMNKIP